MEITLSRVIDAARQRRAAVTAEVAGYIVLLVSRAMTGQPREARPENILLSAEGEVGVLSGSPATACDCERGLRELLGSLLGLSHAAPPALRAACERGSPGELQAFEAELLAALIPLNQAAAGRALARLYRETSRAQLAASHAEGAEPLGACSSTPAVAEAAPARLNSQGPAPEEVDLEIEVDFIAEEICEDSTGDARADELDLLLEDEPSALPASEVPAESLLRPSAARLAREDEPVRSGVFEVVDEPVRSGVFELTGEPVRSDVRALIDGFLAHTRSDERIAADLRKLIGLDAAGRAPSRPEAAALGR